jgi:phage N-6-adenine-methyltransferase
VINKSLFSSDSSEWETPQKFFDELNEEFCFTLDPCATNKNAKCDQYITKGFDGLSITWSDYSSSVFMNPPYGREIGKWVKKAYEESRKGIMVVCLLPARTDTKWFHEYCMKGKIRFLRGRLYFTDQNGKNGRAPFPSMIVTFGGKKE